MFSPYLENFTPAFCAEAPEAESDHMKKLPPSRPRVINGALGITNNKGGSHHVLYRD